MAERMYAEPPRVHRPRLLLLWYSMLAPPVAWAGQLLVGYFVAAEVCDGRVGHGELIQHLITAVALVLTLLAGAAGLYEWFRTPDAPETVRLDRARFMALSGIFLSGLFLMLIIFGDIPNTFLERHCATAHG